jgi:hypothetical protein
LVAILNEQAAKDSLTRKSSGSTSSHPLSATAPSFSSKSAVFNDPVAHQHEVSRLLRELEKVSIALSLPDNELANIRFGMEGVPPQPIKEAVPHAEEYEPERLIGPAYIGNDQFLDSRLNAYPNTFQGGQGIWSAPAPHHPMPGIPSGDWNNSMHGGYTAPLATNNSEPPIYVIARGDSYRLAPQSVVNGMSHVRSGNSSRPSGGLLPPYPGPPFGDVSGPFGPSRMAPLGPVGSRLSPTASAFPYNTMAPMGPTPWNAQVCEPISLFGYHF